MRYTSAGELDPTFGVNGVVITDDDAGLFDDGRALAIAGNGSICSDESTGTNLFSSLDFWCRVISPKWDPGSKLQRRWQGQPFPRVVWCPRPLGRLQADGKELAWRCHIRQWVEQRVRFSPGLPAPVPWMPPLTVGVGFPRRTPDEFWGDGCVIALQTDGKILMAGSRLATTNSFAVVRYLNDVGSAYRRSTRPSLRHRYSRL